jgi:hypothetical protein
MVTIAFSTNVFQNLFGKIIFGHFKMSIFENLQDF